MMKINLTCSNCGAKRLVSNHKVEYTTKAIKDGWNSFGAALYCPKCCETWDDRNPGRPLAGERNTFIVIMGQFLKEMQKK